MAPFGPFREDLEGLVSLCKRRGFVFPSGDIYGGRRAQKSSSKHLTRAVFDRRNAIPA